MLKLINAIIIKFHVNIVLQKVLYQLLLDRCYLGAMFVRAEAAYHLG
jgi:hypothetical protein